jgi:hypothetical protein
LDSEAQVLLAADDYGAFHMIPVPPYYLRQERGWNYWLDGALPDIVANRSLQRVAFRASAWASRNPKYDARSVDDPDRSELLILCIAEKGRFEVWHAEIGRSRSGLPGIGEWKLYATEKDPVAGALPGRIGVALDKRAGAKGPTMPAAEMVLGAWDVPYDYFPIPNVSGPLDHLRDCATSSYLAFFRPESPGVVIIGQAFIAPDEEDTGGYIDGAIEALHEQGHKDFDGPRLGDRTHYVEGKADGERQYRYTALWRYGNAFLEVAVAGPLGRFTKSQLYKYAAIQDKRARAELARTGLDNQSSIAS